MEKFFLEREMGMRFFLMFIRFDYIDFYTILLSVTGNSIKVYYIHCSPLIQSVFLITKGNQVGQTRLALGESILAGPNHLVLL